jgi:predicted ATPase
MEQRGDLRRDDEGRWGVGEALDWATLPARVQAAIAERVERLPEELRELLAVASVEGEEFTAEVLAAVQGSDAAAVIRRLSGPLSREQGLVIALGQRRLGEEQVSRYRFRHELFLAGDPRVRDLPQAGAGRGVHGRATGPPLSRRRPH